MKIYKDSDGHLTIIYGKSEEPSGVTLVKDNGPKARNIFGEIPRYSYHWANVFGNTPHTTSTNFISLSPHAKRYKLVRSKQK